MNITEVILPVYFKIKEFKYKTNFYFISISKFLFFRAFFWTKAKNLKNFEFIINKHAKCKATWQSKQDCV